MALDLSLIVCRHKPPRDQVKPHRHRQDQWFLCREGLLALGVENRVHRLEAGEALLIRSGRSRSLLPVPRRRSYIFALFDYPDLDLEALYHRPLRLDQDLWPDAAALARELTEVGGADSPLLCRALLVRLLVGLARAARRAGGGGTAPADRALVEQVERVMRQHLHRHLTREQLARTVHVSAPHLARRFKAITGTTLHRRLRELRVDLARILLRDSTISVAEVARSVGFRSDSHFTKAFKAVAGRTPRNWRAEPP